MSPLCAEEENIPCLSYRKVTEEEVEMYLGDITSDKDSHFNGACTLDAKHFRSNQKFYLCCANLGQKPIKLGDCFTDNEGKMLFRSSTRSAIIELSNHILSFGNYLPGEPMEYALIPWSRKDKNKYSVTIIPNPLEAEDQAGHKVSMQILTSDLELFAFELTNFKPNEIIEVISISGKETIPRKRKVNEHGKLRATIQPAVVGETTGLATFKAISLDTDMIIELNYEWGFPK
ncbi:MAG: hypothetical protein S4CHLAM123_08050 [Chlamydiales bacterium]|nr:hypothetical protein [Chlamydiales bacterium]